MPFVTDGPDGPYWTSKNGQNFGLMNGVGPAGAEVRSGQPLSRRRLASTGLYEDGKKASAGRPIRSCAGSTWIATALTPR
jgi:hypothetical protein